MARLNPNLDAKEQVFVDEYLISLDPKSAAIKAKYSKSLAATKAYQWVSNRKVKPHVYDAVEKGKLARANRTEITQDRVLKEIAKVAFATMRNFITVDADGQPKIDMDGTPEDDLDAMSEVSTETIVERRGKGDDAEVDIIRKTRIKLHSKLDALEKLAQHTGVYKERDKDRADSLAMAFAEILQRGSKMPLRRDAGVEDAA